MYKTTTNIYVPETMVAHIVKNYDASAQPMICMEELAELQQAISKQCRKRESNLPEEIAHSLISMSVLMTIYGIKPSDVEAEIKRKKEKLGIGHKMKAHILTYGDQFAPGCCDDENGKTVPLTIVPDHDNPNRQPRVVGKAELSVTDDGVDAEITVNDGMLGDAVMKMISDDEAYILDPFILKLVETGTEGGLNSVCTKCKIYEVSVISKEEIKDESV